MEKSKIKTKSLLRIEEYRALSELSLDGDILDVGGSKKSGYHDLIKGNHKIITGNIDQSYGIDVVFDAEKKWPFEDSRFSGVLFMNVLEHLFDYNNAVEESFRVLKEGGIVAGVVPFLLNIHGCPSDYFRFTKFALERIFLNAGFKTVKIKELGSGVFSVDYQIKIGLIRWQWLAYLMMSVCKKMDRLLRIIKPNNKMTAEFMPLGYYFEAER